MIFENGFVSYGRYCKMSNLNRESDCIDCDLGAFWGSKILRQPHKMDMDQNDPLSMKVPKKKSPIVVFFLEFSHAENFQKNVL